MSNAGSSLLRCPPDSLEYDEDDGALVDAEVRSLLLKLGAEALVVLLEHPANGRPVRHRFLPYRPSGNRHARRRSTSGALPPIVA
jgi:hypothetical protein